MKDFWEKHQKVEAECLPQDSGNDVQYISADKDKDKSVEMVRFIKDILVKRGD